MTSGSSKRLPAEWEPCGAVLMAWPHGATDWAPMLDEVRRCCRAIVEAVTETVPVVLAGQELDAAADCLSGIENLVFLPCPNNDTWTRDFGPICVLEEGRTTINDFGFNGWGLKFAADKDNLVTWRLTHGSCAVLDGRSYRNRRDFILEGGSIDSDGQGTVMTTASCLLSPNRNGGLTRDEIEKHLEEYLGADRVLWLEHGAIDGDDTDGHIDTLARFVSPDTIVYVAGQADMLEDLRRFRQRDGRSYNLVELPAAKAVTDPEGMPMPATYANFLVLPGRVLVPAYGDTQNDAAAAKILEKAFPGRRVVTVDCRALIRQHGSLHCATMQLPEDILKI